MEEGSAPDNHEVRRSKKIMRKQEMKRENKLNQETRSKSTDSRDMAQNIVVSGEVRTYYF